MSEEEQRLNLEKFLLTALAITGPEAMKLFKRRPSRTTCISCGSNIPPGKANRECKECRNNGQA